ncbi:MAG: hypothetical protein RMM17_04410 [Acidobacteriota bacterium]|nr:hypothetical protein [Blastocatellia bacterium]MDW8411905.1 hypothetical protein [Acidobacteriota bacterium]
MDDKDPVLLAKKGFSTQIFTDAERFYLLLTEALAKAPPMAFLDDGRELPCYVIELERFYTPVCYSPPASRQVLLVRDADADEWLLFGATWFSGVGDMVISLHLYIDELQIIESAIRRISQDSNLRIDSGAEIKASSRGIKASSLASERL